MKPTHWAIASAVALCFACEPPTVRVSPNPVTAHEQLFITGSGFRGLAQLRVSWCAVDSQPGDCPGFNVSAFENGLMSANMPALPFVRAGGALTGRLVDCTVAPGCAVFITHVTNPSQAPIVVPVTVEPLPASAGTVDLEVLGRSDGNVLFVVASGSGWTPGRELLALHCSGGDFSTCSAQSPITLDVAGAFSGACYALDPLVFGDPELDCTRSACSLVIADPNALTATAVRLPLNYRTHKQAESCP